MKWNNFIPGRTPNETKQHLNLAFTYLKENKVEEAVKELKWIEVSDNIREKSASWASKNNWSLLIGFICLLAISIGFTLRTPSTKVTIELVTKVVNIHLTKTWHMKDLVSDSIFIDHIIELQAPGIGLSIRQQEPFNLSLSGKKISIPALSFSSGSYINFDILQDKLTLSLINDSIQGDFNIMTGRVIIAPVVDTFINEVVPPETFSFRTCLSTAEPLKLELTDTSEMYFQRLYADDVGFLEESPPGSGIFESLIQEGTILIHATGKKTDLQTGDFLKLGTLNCKRLDILKQKDLLKIRMQATTTKLETGPEFSIENLKPTLLEYIFYQQTLTFIFSSALFLWGLLWSLKNSLFK